MRIVCCLVVCSLVCLASCGGGPRKGLEDGRVVIVGADGRQVEWLRDGGSPVDASLPEPTPREQRAGDEQGTEQGAEPSVEPSVPEQGVEPSTPDAGVDAEIPEEGPEPTGPEPEPVSMPEQAPREPGGGDTNPVGTPCKVGDQSGSCMLTTDCTGDRVSTPGYCPGPKEIQCCTKKPTIPAGQCDPNAKPTPNTGLQEAPGQGGCPAGMKKVDTFCIDVYEAMLVEVLANGTTQQWSPYYNPGNRRMRAMSVKGAVPQGYISGDQAAKACKEAGKRLCTDQEWLRACRGPNSTTYPYGNTRQPGVCNDARSIHPAVEYFQSSQQWVFSRIQHQCLNQLANGLAKTGDKTGCITAEGIHDMMGNLHEWTSNSTGIFRGGFYVDTYRNGNGCLYRTTAHNTLHWDYSTGFRCCANLGP